MYFTWYEFKICYRDPSRGEANAIPRVVSARSFKARRIADLAGALKTKV